MLNITGGSFRKKAKRDPASHTLCFNYKWMMNNFQNRRYVGILYAIVELYKI